MNVTLRLPPNQELPAAKACDTNLSPFIGRLDDIDLNGSDLIQDIRVICDNFDFKTEFIATSIRTANNVARAAPAGAEFAKIPHCIIRNLASLPLTSIEMDQFLMDRETAGQSFP